MAGAFAADACETIASAVRNKQTINFIHLFIVFLLCQVRRIHSDFLIHGYSLQVACQQVKNHQQIVFIL
jgi:hypothetical protein